MREQTRDIPATMTIIPRAEAIASCPVVIPIFLIKSSLVVENKENASVSPTMTSLSMKPNLDVI
jgi:hypothetical protein